MTKLPATSALQYLLSLPPNMAEHFSHLEGYSRPEWFAASDPANSKLGSGGGTANLLMEAWRQTSPGLSLTEWLRQSRKLIIHGGGHSRRLPAYAAVGKPFIPIPALRNTYGQKFNQTLLDLQRPDYELVLRSAPQGMVAMITSGDVLLRFGRELPPLPNADVVTFGMSVPAEVATHFGVFFMSRHRPGELAFALQKPTVARIRELVAADYTYLVDTGMWLLSEQAVHALLAHCGWQDQQQRFSGDLPHYYDLYTEFGLALGAEPTAPEPQISALRSAIVALPQAEFYHLGDNRQLIEAIGSLQGRDSRRSDLLATGTYSSQIRQNAQLASPLHSDNHTLWIENAAIGDGWKLTCEHILTNIPTNEWHFALEPGVCLDLPPIGEAEYCVRAYGIDDRFSGELQTETTHWFGQPLSHWLEARGLSWQQAGLDPNRDIQFAPLFPVLSQDALSGEFLHWLTAKSVHHNADLADIWLRAPRLSASEISVRVNLERLLTQQIERRNVALIALYANQHTGAFYHLDLKTAAGLLAASDLPLPPAPNAMPPIAQMHDHMWRATILRQRGTLDWQNQERQAFDSLQTAIISEIRQKVVAPQRNVLDDQIIWGRAPIRFDLAGGWTDTPPYCLQHGGNVVNVAANLNGQPPIQVFARSIQTSEIVLRSIDLGVEQRVTSYADLESYAQPGSEFALAKAALVQAGFLPRFYGGSEYPSLQQHLKAFGGGIEMSLLAAVPQGSGLGTSSILAAATLGVLSELCGLDWDDVDLIQRTLALEQMMTTGGGWQDQAGGITRSIKRVETAPGFAQKPVIHWLPEYLLGADYANRTVLLYYTGLTRLAKNILQEIVRGMFLNASDRLGILQQIGENGTFVANALQRNDYGLLCEAVRRSWELNCQLDAETNPPAVQHILDTVGDYLAAAKLLGAGGGGYILMMAKDETAAGRIRQRLAENPPNNRARFNRFSISPTGLDITRS